MPSLTNQNTRSQMALDISLCRTIKGRKSMSFLGPKIFIDFFIIITIAIIFFFNFLKVDFFYYISLRSYLQGDPNGNKNRFGSFLGHPCHLRSRGIFSFSYASLLFNNFIMQSLTLPFFFISILNSFYDGEINTYTNIHYYDCMFLSCHVRVSE